MNSHYKGITIAISIVIAAFVAALAWGQNFLALGVLLGGGVLLFVFSIAYMRPSGRSPERHPKIDRIVNDTKP